MSAQILPPFDGLNRDLAPLIGLPGRILEEHGARQAAEFCGAFAMDLKRACASPEIIRAVAPTGITGADLDAVAD